MVRHDFISVWHDKIWSISIRVPSRTSSGIRSEERQTASSAFVRENYCSKLERNSREKTEEETDEQQVKENAWLRLKRTAINQPSEQCGRISGIRCHRLPFISRVKFVFPHNKPSDSRWLIAGLGEKIIRHEKDVAFPFQNKKKNL